MKIFAIFALILEAIRKIFSYTLQINKLKSVNEQMKKFKLSMIHYTMIQLIKITIICKK